MDKNWRKFHVLRLLPGLLAKKFLQIGTFPTNSENFLGPFFPRFNLSLLKPLPMKGFLMWMAACPVRSKCDLEGSVFNVVPGDVMTSGN